MAVRFDAAADRLLRTANTPSTTGPWTVMFWVRLVSDLNAYSTFCYIGSDNYSSGYQYVGTTGDGTRLAADANGTEVTGSNLTTGVWYHIAIVRVSEFSLRIYLDGTLDITNTNNFSNNSRWEFGAVGTGNNDRADIRLAHIKYWDAELTAEEVQQEMRVIRPHRSANLAGWYPLFPGSGERTRDYSGLGRNFTEGGTLTDEDGPPVSWGAPVIYVPFTSAGAATRTRDASASAALSATLTRTAGASAAFSATVTRTASASAALSLAGIERTAAASAALQATLSRNAAASAAFSATLTRTASASAAVQATLTRAAASSAALSQAGNTRTASSSAALSQAGIERTVSASAALSAEGTVERTVPASAALSQAGIERTVEASAALQTTLARTTGASAALQTTLTRTATASAAVLATLERTVASTAALSRAENTRTASASAALQATLERSVDLSAALLATLTRTASASASLIERYQRTASASAAFSQDGVTRTVPATASIAYTVIPVRSPTSVTLADTGRRVVQLADDGRRLLVLPDDGRRRVEVV